METREALTNAQAIKTFFEKDDGRKVEMMELKALSNIERAELGGLCALELGCDIKVSAEQHQIAA